MKRLIYLKSILVNANLNTKSTANRLNSINVLEEENETKHQNVSYRTDSTENSIELIYKESETVNSIYNHTNQDSINNDCDIDFINLKPYDDLDKPIDKKIVSEVISPTESSSEEEWLQTQLVFDSRDPRAFSVTENVLETKEELLNEQEVFLNLPDYLSMKTNVETQCNYSHPSEIPNDRCYTFNEKLAIEEDVCHEFKGHRSISIYDIPRAASSEKFFSRSSVSVTVCGLLNTGLGGTVYLGVNDNGRVLGLPLTLYQRDHVVSAVAYTLSRFTPRVPPDFWSINFVPVYSSKDEQESYNLNWEVDSCNTDTRRTRHALWKPAYCWCDEDSVARMAMGESVPYFIIEVHIRPWDAHSMNYSLIDSVMAKEMKNPEKSTGGGILNFQTFIENGKGDVINMVKQMRAGDKIQSLESVVDELQSEKPVEENSQAKSRSKFILARQAAICPSVPRLTGNRVTEAAHLTGHKKDFGFSSVFRFPPVFVEETGICYLRHNSCMLKYSLDDVRTLLEHRVDEHCTLLAQKMERRVREMREERDRLRGE